MNDNPNFDSICEDIAKTLQLTKLEMLTASQWLPILQERIKSASAEQRATWRQQAISEPLKCVSKTVKNHLPKLLKNPEDTTSAIIQITIPKVREITETLTPKPTKQDIQNTLDKFKPKDPNLLALFATKICSLNTNHQAFDFVAFMEMQDEKSLFVTITSIFSATENDTGTFSIDNWLQMKMYIAESLKYNATAFGIIIRREEKTIEQRSQLPYQSVVAIQITANKITFIPREETRMACKNDPNTGKPYAEEEHNVIYCDVPDVFPTWRPNRN